MSDDPVFTPDIGRLWVADEAAETFRVPVEDVRLPKNVSAGCNLGVVASLWHTLRATTEDPPPVGVTREPDGTWRISDGRHRFLAAVMAGRPDVLCSEVLGVPAVPKGSDSESPGH